MARSRPAPAQSVPVFRAQNVCATDGANMGDPVSFAEELILDDVYELTHGAEPERLSIFTSQSSGFCVAEDTSIGTPLSLIHI